MIKFYTIRHRFLLVIISYFLISFFYSNFSNAQRVIPKLNLTFPVSIEIENYYPASGFFYKYNRNIYLVTASHVIFDETFNIKKNLAIVKAPARDYNDKKLNIFEFHLMDLLKADDIKYHNTFDIAIIKFASLDIIDNKNHINKNIKSIFITKSGILSADSSVIKLYDDIFIGDDIIVQGYPSSLGLQNKIQFDHSRPLIRKGAIAGKYDALRTIILDCPVYAGNSGSPVTEITRKGLNYEYKVIGIVSQWIPFNESITNKKLSGNNSILTNSGYSIAVPIDALIELLNN